MLIGLNILVHRLAWFRRAARLGDCRYCYKSLRTKLLVGFLTRPFDVRARDRGGEESAPWSAAHCDMAECQERLDPGEWSDEAEARTARPKLMGNRRTFTARAMGALLAGLAGTQSGCNLAPSGWHPPSVTKILSPQPAVPNPLVVPSSDFENVWNKTVAVVDKYFDIESENRLSRTIRTQPQMGATMLEPWALDSATFQDRLEATLQTIRRVAVVRVNPAPTGGFLIKVEVIKFLEDMAKPDRQAAGRAVFNNDFAVNRTREIVGPVPAPLGWIDRGRDRDLEQAILAGIRDALFL